MRILKALPAVDDQLFCATPVCSSGSPSNFSKACRTSALQFAGTLPGLQRSRSSSSARQPWLLSWLHFPQHVSVCTECFSASCFSLFSSLQPDSSLAARAWVCLACLEGLHDPRSPAAALQVSKQRAAVL